LARLVLIMCSVKAATCCVARLKKTCLAVPWEFVPDRTERHTALHVGEVPYGNVGAVDRLDFTVIGPAVNEVVRMEKLCEPLGQQILFSSRFAEAAGRCDGRLESLGHFQLRGVDEAKEIFGLRLSQTAALQRVEA
jgi:class 3 adenylate cyclase